MVVSPFWNEKEYQQLPTGIQPNDTVLLLHEGRRYHETTVRGVVESSTYSPNLGTWVYAVWIVGEWQGPDNRVRVGSTGRCITAPQEGQLVWRREEHVLEQRAVTWRGHRVDRMIVDEIETLFPDGWDK